MADLITCPFCGYTNGNEYTIQLHIEERHTDDSPFVPDNERPRKQSRISKSSNASSSNTKGSNASGSKDSSMPGDMWTRCTRAGCGEHVLLSEIDEHLDLHAAAALADQDEEFEEQAPPLPPRRSPPRAESPPRTRSPPRVDNSPWTRSPRRARSPLRARSPNRFRIPARTSPTEEFMRKDPFVKPPFESPRKTSAAQQMVKSRSPHDSPRKLEKRHLKVDDISRKGSSILSFFSGTSTHTRSTVRRLREPQDPGRLGKKDLGPYAYEKRMPQEVRDDLIQSAKPEYVNRIGRDGRLIRQAYVHNETVGLIPAIADVDSLDRHTRVTYLCHPCVRHIRKLQCDGNFCGYWNIQVLMSWVQHMKPHGPQQLPNVIQIQASIEDAWDNGILSYGRTETGGILDTRKWIGTQEALAFFNRIKVPCEALSVKGDEETGKSAASELLDYVEAYFMSGTDNARKCGTSIITQLAPIYFQRLGHSMTIVGLERQHDGSRNLLVFDSSFGTSKPMQRLAQGLRASGHPDELLKTYRRSEESLEKWDEFELLIPHPIVNEESTATI